MKQNGFTLIELMIIVAIVGILAAIILPAFTQGDGQMVEAASSMNSMITCGD